MRFADPYLLALVLLIPLLLFLKKRISADKTAGSFSNIGLLAAYQPTWRLRFRWLPTAIRALALLLLIVALARPQGSRAETDIPAEGIDIALVMDTSGSMNQPFSGSSEMRLAAAQRVIGEFITGRRDDRLGFVIFAGRSLVLSPLTLDYEALSLLVEQSDLPIVGEGTAIGSGLTDGVSLLRDSRSRSRIAILLTDGEDNAGATINPVTAAQLAESLGIRVYTIGIIEANNSESVDAETLTQMAELTGGRYFSAENARALEQIYDDIDRLEKSRIEQPQFAAYKELAPYFLAFALVLLAIEITLRATVWRQTA